MNRRGTVLVTTLLALLMSGALASAALAAARLRMLAGQRAAAAVRTTLAVRHRLESRIALLEPAALDSLPIGVPVGLGPGDSILRLGPATYQVRVVVVERLAEGSVIARDGASQLLQLEMPCLPAVRLQTAPGPSDGMVSPCLGPAEPGSPIFRFRRVPGGWWRGS